MKNLGIAIRMSFALCALPGAALYGDSRANVWTYYKNGSAYGIRKGGWTIPVNGTINNGLLTVVADNVSIKLAGSGDLDLWDVAVDMGNGTTNDITAITFTNARFKDNKNIKSVRMNNIVTMNFQYFFYQCTAMTNAVLDYHPTLFDGVIPAGCFQNDKVLKITPAAVITPAVTTIGAGAFYNAKSVYGELDTLNVKSIGNNAFRGDNHAQPILTSLVFGTRLASIGTYAFWNVSTIQRIHFKGRQAPTISGSAFGSVKPATIIFVGLPPSDTTASLDNLSASFNNSSTTHANTIYASKKIGNGAWLALASPLVSTEVSHAPAGNFGVYKRGNYHVAWFMPRKSPYEIQGIKVIVR